MPPNSEVATLRIRQQLIRNPKNSLATPAVELEPVTDYGIFLPESEEFLTYDY
jgi:hypothetical protein